MTRFLPCQVNTLFLYIPIKQPHYLVKLTAHFIYLNICVEWLTSSTTLYCLLSGYTTHTSYLYTHLPSLKTPNTHHLLLSRSSLSPSLLNIILRGCQFYHTVATFAIYRTPFSLSHTRVLTLMKKEEGRKKATINFKPPQAVNFRVSLKLLAI